MSSLMPSDWVTRHCPPCHATGGTALDLACGKGRHSFWLADQGWQVTALDRDLSDTGTGENTGIEWIEANLESGPWPLGDRQFDLVVVVNYLHRPLFENLRDAVKSGGTLLYETFMIGNEAFGRPRSPEFLLHPGELPNAFSGWKINAFEQGPQYKPAAAVPFAVKQFQSACKP
ncbi:MULTISPECIES: class I SAM-dependent methyltransferase [Thalassospira]|jgi:SAM-dependent methyltransferase|nr:MULTISPECIES: class I SAM-dependent methyltransferase [Thalassospira]MDM7977919.1 class I SAM-dependent methyltransferase [Thalassospira xiamenensis]|tara:strand:+ start:653 stop:1174 length:522 start_codon:yes stop_codon:yes gene_type:complete